MRALLPVAALLLLAAAPPTVRLSVHLPDEEGLLPDRGSVSAEAVNNNCLACHSAAMIRNQPHLTRMQWAETVTKMRNVFAAPIEPADEAAILDWLAAPQAD